MTITAILGITAVGAGAALTAALAARGLRQVGAGRPGGGLRMAVAAAIGGPAGGAALLAMDRSEGWRVLPAFFLWACVLAAAGLCDALTQRVPTVLVRPGMLAVATLFGIGFTTDHAWQELAFSAIASLASGAAMLGCWRFLDAGFGDVRLALLGGLGLGNADGRGLCIGLLVFAAIVIGQVCTRRLRCGISRTRVPIGLALAVGFILSVVL